MAGEQRHFGPLRAGGSWEQNPNSGPTPLHHLTRCNGTGKPLLMGWCQHNPPATHSTNGHCRDPTAKPQPEPPRLTGRKSGTSDTTESSWIALSQGHLKIMLPHLLPNLRQHSPSPAGCWGTLGIPREQGRVLGAGFIPAPCAW